MVSCEPLFVGCKIHIKVLITELGNLEEINCNKVILILIFKIQIFTVKEVIEIKTWQNCR